MAVYSLVSGTWRLKTNIATRVSGSWRDIDFGYSRVAGTWREVYTRRYIEDPTVVIEGQPSNVPERPIIRSSLFQVQFSEGRHINTDWQILASNGSTVVWQSLANTTNLYEIQVPEGVLAADTNYFARCRYYVEFLQRWVNAPVMIVDGTPSSVPESPTLQADTSVLSGFSGTHYSTDWAITETNGIVVWHSFDNTTNKTQITVPAGHLATNTTYYFKCRFILQD